MNLGFSYVGRADASPTFRAVWRQGRETVVIRSSMCRHILVTELASKVVRFRAL